MPRVRELFPSGFLAAEDLFRGDVTLTISSVRKEGIPTPPSYKEQPGITVSFKELEAREKKTGRKAQKLKLNVTNAKTIGKLHGPEVDEWVGKQVTLYADTCKLGKDTVPCIRVRKEIPKPKQQQPGADPQLGAGEEQP